MGEVYLNPVLSLIDFLPVIVLVGINILCIFVNLFGMITIICTFLSYKMSACSLICTINCLGQLKFIDCVLALIPVLLSFHNFQTVQYQGIFIWKLQRTGNYIIYKPCTVMCSNGIWIFNWIYKMRVKK